MKSPSTASIETAAVAIELVSIDLQARQQATQTPIFRQMPQNLDPVATSKPHKQETEAIILSNKPSPEISTQAVSVLATHTETAPPQMAFTEQLTSPVPKTTAPPAPVSAQSGYHANHQPDAAKINRVQKLVRNHLETFKYYPGSARRRGIEGHVELAFTLAHNGTANQVSVLHGSGYEVLDHAAMETVYRAQPFPVEYGNYRFSLRFKRL